MQISTKEKNYDLDHSKMLQENEIETLKIVLNENLPAPTKLDEEKIKSFENHKVLLGYLNAYFNHCPIKLSPNVIWQLILNNFSEYVNINSEKLRKKFVNFEGKKKLICIKVGSIKDVNKYKDDLIKEFCDKITENIGKEITDILTPNFSTSTNETIIAGKASIMSTFKMFFDFYFGMASCGIPYIILEGNLNDWEKILEKLKYLSKYDFDINLIEKDIIEIINTKKGKINLDFWRKIIMETREKTEERMPCSIFSTTVEKDFITGWILHFFNEEKVKKNKLNKLIKEIVEAEVNIEDLETGEKKSGVIYSGITDLKQDSNSFVVEPIVNYSFSVNE